MSATNRYEPLFLRYRPQTLHELVGQGSVVKTLTNALSNDRLAHAYLFTGPRGTGKTSSARILAKSINCDEGPTVSPCLQCMSCQSIKDSSSTSVFEIDAASHNSVDDARHLIERAPLATPDGKHKLYIIDECHMLTKEAFNALLKTIEEPPPRVVFILATTEEHKVPQTIVSRCQRLMFRLVTLEEIKAHLTHVAEKERIEITDEALELLCRRSAGGLRDALGLLDQAALLAAPGKPIDAPQLLVLLGALDEDVLLSISEAVLKRNGRQLLETATELLMQGREASLVAVELSKHFLNLAKASYLADSMQDETDLAFKLITGTRPYIKKVTEQAREFERSELSQIVEQLDRLSETIKRSTQPALTLEMGLLSVCNRHEIHLLSELEERVRDLEQRLESGDVPMPLSRPVKPAHSQTRPERANDVSSVNAQEPAPTEPPPALDRVERVESVSADQQTAPVNNMPLPAAEVEQARAEALPEPVEATQVGEPAEPELEPEHTSPAAAVPAKPDDSLPPAAGGGLIELEELWANLLDALQRRHIPSHSLVQMHAFPVSLETGGEGEQLVLGVNKEFFQRSIEKKASYVEQAYKSVTGKEVTVKVKVYADGPGEKKRSSPDSRTVPLTSGPPPDTGSKQPAEPTAIRSTVAESASEAGGAPERIPEPAKVSASKAPPGPENFHGQARASANQAAQEQNRVSKPTAAATESIQASSLIKEAYKLFEGPGSRLIG